MRCWSLTGRLTTLAHQTGGGSDTRQMAMIGIVLAALGASSHLHEPAKRVTTVLDHTEPLSFAAGRLAPRCRWLPRRHRSASPAFGCAAGRPLPMPRPRHNYSSGLTGDRWVISAGWLRSVGRVAPTTGRTRPDRHIYGADTERKKMAILPPWLYRDVSTNRKPSTRIPAW